MSYQLFSVEIFVAVLAALIAFRLINPLFIFFESLLYGGMTKELTVGYPDKPKPPVDANCPGDHASSSKG